MITEDQIVALNPTFDDGVYIFRCDNNSEYLAVDGWHYCPYCNAPRAKTGSYRRTGGWRWVEYECGAEMAPGSYLGVYYIYGVSKMRAGCIVNLSTLIQEDTI